MQILLLLVALLGLAYLGARRVSPQITEKVETTVTEKVSELIARMEGIRLDAYQDQAGIWTIGYGHKIIPGDGFYHPNNNPGGKRTITMAEATALRDADEKWAREAVARSVRVPLSENQERALISLVFNIGTSAFAGSTLVALLNQYRYEEAAQEFPKWNKITKDGVKVVDPILVSRRQTEMELFLS